MRDLIFTHGNEVALVDHDVGGLQHGIAEKAIGAQIFFFNVVSLLFISRHAFEPPERRDHGKQQVQLRMLRHMRLNEHGAAVGIQTGGEPIQKYFD